MTDAMPERFSFGSPQLSASGARPSAQSTEASPFRILLLGDFTGRESRGIVESVRGRRGGAVDFDKFEALMTKLAPQLEF